MSTFPLRVGTPDGLLYEGDVARVVCRTISGDLAILPGHCNYCTALGMGEAHIVLEDGTRRNAACIGGMLSMMNGVCRVLATTWEWEEDIDAAFAEAKKYKDVPVIIEFMIATDEIVLPMVKSGNPMSEMILK